MKYLYVLMLLLAGNVLNGQSFDLQFVTTQNDRTNGGIYEVRVQIRSVGSTFGLGTSNLVFTYNAAGLSIDSLQNIHNFSTASYDTLTLTEPFSGRASVNINLLTTGAGTVVENAFMDVATIRFTIDDVAQSSQLSWRTIPPNRTIVFDDNQTSLIPANNLNGQDDALPIELAAFAAKSANSVILLTWKTESEINNAGFEVYRALEEAGDYTMLASYAGDERLRGAGNSNTQQSYEYQDKLVNEGTTYWYQIADVSYSGERVFHGPISVTFLRDGLTASGDIPIAFALHQNYPNPFNPETTIPFDVPPVANGETHVRIVIYNILGSVVRVLFDDIAAPGVYGATWDGRDGNGNLLGSGVYFVRFQSSAFNKTRKIVFMR